MAVASDIVTFGDLTGSGTQDTVYTSSGVEYVEVRFFNHDSVPRTLSVWVNSVVNANYILKAVTLEAAQSINIEGIPMASGDLIKAEASAATAIGVIVMWDRLS